MTLIGAFHCPNAVVIFADRQETITDYAKWDEGKIYFLESADYRIVVAGAGDPDPINEIWEAIINSIARNRQKTTVPTYTDLKELIRRIVGTVTKKTVFPVPRDQRPSCELIWALQPRGASVPGTGGIDLFRTYRLSCTEIATHYLTGNPVLLTKYLSDMYVSGVIVTKDEAEALAAYLLWEAKEYDPTCGKHSDIYTLQWPHGEISRMTLPESQYWEEHFEHLKKAMKMIPLLSCAGDHVQRIYKPYDYLNRLVTTLKTLSREQEKMKKDNKEGRSKLESRLTKNLKRSMRKYSKPRT
jgi:hypothetical protein